MIVYILFFFFFFLAIVNEMKDIGCPAPSRCQFSTSPLVKDCLVDESDNQIQVYQKIKNGLNYNDRFILWRINFIGATISFIFLWFMIQGNFPSERNLLLGVLIIMFVFYFIDSFYQFHVQKPIKEILEQNVDYLSKFCSKVSFQDKE